MKTWAYSIGVTLIAGNLAWAGFRHPVEQSGVEAQAIQSTPTHQVVISAQRVMPDRMIDTRRPAVAPPMAPAALLPSQLKLPTQMKLQLPTSIPQLKPSPLKIEAQKGPIPRSPSLPSAERFGIPDVHLPNATSGDGLLTMKPESLHLKGLNRAQIHAFLRNARNLPLPSREYTKEVRSRAIAEQFREALHPTPYRSYRTSYQLGIAKIGKIQDPPATADYENMVKRIDSLFLGLEFRYPQAVLSLWELAQAKNNPRNLQARDALFAGLISTRAGWPTSAALLLEESAVKRVEKEERYLKILWAQLELVESPVHLDKIVSRVNPARIKDLDVAGDKANFSMAKRMLFERRRAPQALNPAPDTFAQLISSQDLRDRVQLLSLVGQLRTGNGAQKIQAVDALKTLEAEGSEEVRQESRLALARAFLQKGSGPEALAFYRGVAKNGKNRLEVLAEQTFAEYLSGEHQESLGKAMALQSPYFLYGFAPDIHLVEIMSRKAMCDFGGAEAGVQRFAERYVRELNAIETMLASKTASADYYEKLVSYHDMEQPMRFQRFLLQLAPVMENQKTMNHALVDLGKLDALGLRQKSIERPQGWERFTASMRERWNGRAGELKKQSADAALGEAAYLARRLRQTFAQVELLDLDISTSAAKNYNLQSALNFPAHKQIEGLADIEKLRWPFENEIWEDEIDYMKAKNPSKCAVASLK